MLHLLMNTGTLNINYQKIIVGTVLLVLSDRKL